MLDVVNYYCNPVFYLVYKTYLEICEQHYCNSERSELDIALVILVAQQANRPQYGKWLNENPHAYMIMLVKNSLLPCNSMYSIIIIIIII